MYSAFSQIGHRYVIEILEPLSYRLVKLINTEELPFRKGTMSPVVKFHIILTHNSQIKLPYFSHSVNEVI